MSNSTTMIQSTEAIALKHLSSMENNGSDMPEALGLNSMLKQPLPLSPAAPNVVAVTPTTPNPGALLTQPMGSSQIMGAFDSSTGNFINLIHFPTMGPNPTQDQGLLYLLVIATNKISYSH